MHEYSVKLRGVTEKDKVVAKTATFSEDFVVFLDQGSFPVAAYASDLVVSVRRADAEGSA